MAHESYTIGRAARAAGVGVETIRFYERKGLIEQPLKPAQRARRYPKATVDRIRALRQGQELGFSLAEIDGLLALRADPTADCGDVRQRAQDHLEDVERKQARLGEVADKLRELIAACPGRGATHACAILDTFSLPDSETDGVTTHPGREAGTPTELRVQGMACGGCAASVRALLCDLPGVHDAAVDRVTGIARLRVEASVTTPAMLAARLTESGFPATPR